MLFISEQSVLVEVKTNNQEFLIGDKYFSFLPSWVLNRILPSANWNRALRYLSIENDDFFNLGFFLIRFDLYLNDNKIVCLSKKSFEQEIINQEKFQNQFLNKIFDFRNRNSQNFVSKKLPYHQNLEIINSLDILDLNHCWVSDNFKLDNYKFKVLFKRGIEFRIERTPQHQFIYYSNFDFQNLDLVDLKTESFYEEGKYFLNVEACLRFKFEDPIWKDQFLNHLVKLIQDNKVLLDKYKNWHLFNVTNDFKYIIIELNQIFSSFNNFEESIRYLEDIFKELKRSYFSIMFSNVEVKNIFSNFAKTEIDYQELKKTLNRYDFFKLKD